jgi:hypothetical protein
MIVVLSLYRPGQLCPHGPDLPNEAKANNVNSNDVISNTVTKDPISPETLKLHVIQYNLNQ